MGGGVPSGLGDVSQHAVGVERGDDESFGNGQAVRAVGVVEQGDFEVAFAEVERAGKGVPEDARVGDAEGVEIVKCLTYSFLALVAAMVVGEKKGGHAGPPQVAGYLPRGAEAGVAAEVVAAEGGLQIGDGEIGSDPKRGYVLKAREKTVVAAFGVERALNLRGVEHDVAAEKQSDGRVGLWNCQGRGDSCGRMCLFARVDAKKKDGEQEKEEGCYWFHGREGIKKRFGRSVFSFISSIK